MADAAVRRLTRSQQAAVARLAYCLEQPRAVALLCGPGGVGKSLVLDAVAGAVGPAARGVAVRSLEGAAAAPTPGVLLVDDAHLARDGEIAELIERFLRTRPDGSVALAGEGRLLTLVARDRRVEQAVSLRAALPPFRLDESRIVVAGLLAAVGGLDDRDAVARTIHEIAGGIPAAVARLAELAAVVAASTPGRPLVPDDIEAIHRRLSLQAA